MSDEIPLIYTKNGNVPESTLRYEHRWEDSDKMTVLLEFWYDKETGELVKNNFHGMAKQGLVLGSEQARMG